jgi:L-amino acid N-acyltransferase YncA
MNLVPITISDALEFVARHHRHGGAPHSYLFAVACAEGEEVVGVAVIGRPVARMLQDGWTAEVIRLCTDGTKNACSMLYGAAWRACRALGYRRLVTYILDSEPGVTVRAAGFKLVGQAGGGSWHRENRPRVDRHPTQGKLRWERTANEA